MSSNYLNSFHQWDPAEFESPVPHSLSGMTWNLKYSLRSFDPILSSSSSWDQTRLFSFIPAKQGQKYFRKSHGKSSNKKQKKPQHHMDFCFSSGVYLVIRPGIKSRLVAVSQHFLHSVINDDQKQEVTGMHHFLKATFFSLWGKTYRAWSEKSAHISTLAPVRAITLLLLISCFLLDLMA